VEDYFEILIQNYNGGLISKKYLDPGRQGHLYGQEQKDKQEFPLIISNKGWLTIE
jgi:hypothetical protein